MDKRTQAAREKFEVESVPFAVETAMQSPSYFPTLHGRAADLFDHAMQAAGRGTRAWRGVRQ